LKILALTRRMELTSVSYKVEESTSGGMILITHRKNRTVWKLKEGAIGKGATLSKLGNPMF
ncbi:hypothetical protein HAX54_021426, partial [Datura stramonium]|nr:hypothetical protein [Datura stramonium]